MRVGLGDNHLCGMKPLPTQIAEAPAELLQHCFGKGQEKDATLVLSETWAAPCHKHQPATMDEFVDHLGAPVTVSRYGLDIQRRTSSSMFASSK